jgi:hypothetical protein
MSPVVPERCQNLKCKATEIVLIDNFLHTDSEYREHYECAMCGRAWFNIYKYSKTVRAKADE